MTLSDVNPPGTGVMPDDRECNAFVRGGVVCEGYCYPFALFSTSAITNDGLTASTTPGDPGYVYGTIVGGDTFSAATPRAARCAIALEDVADGAIGRFKVKGIVRAKVAHSTGTSITAGEELVLNVTATSALVAPYLDAKDANGGNAPRKYYALSLESLTSVSGSSSDGTTMLVDFDGWDGIGGAGNSA